MTAFVSSTMQLTKQYTGLMEGVHAGVIILYATIILLNSGRASLQLDLSVMKDNGYSVDNPVPPKHALNITIPGAVAGWLDTVEKHGSGKVCVCVFVCMCMSVALCIKITFPLCSDPPA